MQIKIRKKTPGSRYHHKNMIKNGTQNNITILYLNSQIIRVIVVNIYSVPDDFISPSALFAYFNHDERTTQK